MSCVLLPSGEDVIVLVKHVQATLSAQGAESSDAIEATSPIKAVTEGILANLDTAMLFMCWPSTAIADPVSYFICSKKDLLDLQQKLVWNLEILTQEEKHHGLLFSGPKVKLAYQKFFVACDLIERWCRVTLDLTRTAELGSQRPSSSSDASVVVNAVLVQDVTLSYANLIQSSLLFFSEDYTAFDAKCQRRILNSKYLHNIQQCITSAQDEVKRLESIRPILERSANGQRLEFRPSLEQFIWLRETLTLYASVSLVADDYSSLLYFRLLLQTVTNDLKCLSPAVAELPKPSAASPQTQQGAPDAIVAPWQPPAERLPDMQATFARVDDIYSRVNDLRKSLQSDTSSKNKSHRTKMIPSATGTRQATAASAAPSPAPLVPPQRGIFGWAVGLAKTAVAAVTCSAEAPTTSPGSQVAIVSDKSPLAQEKEQLLAEVTAVCNAVDHVVGYLETTYPGLYSSGWSSRAGKAAGKILKGVEAVTTVFS